MSCNFVSSLMIGDHVNMELFSLSLALLSSLLRLTFYIERYVLCFVSFVAFCWLIDIFSTFVVCCEFASAGDVLRNRRGASISFWEARKLRNVLNFNGKRGSFCVESWHESRSILIFFNWKTSVMISSCFINLFKQSSLYKQASLLL